MNEDYGAVNTMNKPTYQKSRFRWAHNADTWPHYRRVIGVGVDCDGDAAGYFLNSDGSRTSTSDEDAALILLFARTLAARGARMSVMDRLRRAIAKRLLGI